MSVRFKTKQNKKTCLVGVFVCLFVRSVVVVCSVFVSCFLSVDLT